MRNEDEELSREARQIQRRSQSQGPLRKERRRSLIVAAVPELTQQEPRLVWNGESSGDKHILAASHWAELSAPELGM